MRRYYLLKRPSDQLFISLEEKSIIDRTLQREKGRRLTGKPRVSKTRTTGSSPVGPATHFFPRVKSYKNSRDSRKFELKFVVYFYYDKGSKNNS